MRKTSVKKSWIWLSVIVLFVGIALVLSFVPMRFKNGTYNSFLKAIPVSNDLRDGMSVAYAFECDYSEGSVEYDKSVAEATATLQRILRDQGYVSATVKYIGNSRLEATLSQPTFSADLTATMSLLGAGGIGGGKLEIRTSNDASTEPILTGADHVKGVELASSGGYTYTIVRFNQEGKSILQNLAYEESLTGQATSYYLFFGGSSSITGGQAFSSTSFVDNDLYIGGFEDRESAVQYRIIVEAGSLNTELQTVNVRDVFYVDAENSAVLIVLLVLNLAVVVGFLTFIAIRFKLLSVLAFFINVFAISITLFLCSFMDWMEIGGVALGVTALALALINLQIIYVFNSMKREMAQGKPLDVSIDIGFSKTVLPIVVLNCFLIIAGFTTAIAFEGLFRVFGSLCVITACASLVFVLPFLKGTVNLLFGLTNDAKKFGLEVK